MAVGANNWPVADSEDEDEFGQLGSSNAFEASAAARTDSDTTTAPGVSLIQTAFTPDQPRTPSKSRLSLSTIDESLFTPLPGGTELTISDFTNVPSTSAAPPAMDKKSRPRPRVVIKKTVISSPNTHSASTTFPHISDSSILAARQTDDSIHPATTTSFFSDAIDDVYSSLDIAERAKMRSRRSQTAKKPVQPSALMNEVIELTSSDEDELALKPMKRQKKQGGPAPKPKALPKARPKPRLKVKPAAALPSGSPPSPRISDHPAPVSSLQCGSSQPPASTLPTIPPSTPPQAHEPTTFSSPIVTTRKRKRIRPSIAEDDDEMDMIGGGLPGVSPSSTMPPPFFAPSSSVPTDSGIEIPPVEVLSGRGKKKQGPSGKKAVQNKGKNKGKKGKKAGTTKMVEDAERLTQDPFTLATHDTEGHDSPAVGNPTATDEAAGKQTTTKKGKARVIYSEEEDELVPPPKPTSCHSPPADEEEGQRSKENLRPDDLSPPKGDSSSKHTSTPGLQVRGSSSKPRSTPMSELIRRVNSQPNSPFPTASRTYSPFLKSSRTMLSKIAPLHPNRRTPPPPLPRPPPPKKSKKQLEMEEKIEEELAETINGWSCLTDDERKVLRKARIDAEFGHEE